MTISNNGEVNSGDFMSFYFDFTNRGDVDFDNLRIQVGIPELGIARRAGPFHLSKDKSMTKELTVFVPYGTPAGEYLVRITLFDDEAKRVQTRYITVYE
jgi:uncharacterized membrane protein